MKAARRTALVTGASAGLGAEFARQLAARGNDLVLVARRQDRLEALAERLRAAHPIEVLCLQADLCDRETPERLFEALAARDVRVDILVNNAGASGPNLLDKPGFEQHGRFLELMAVSAAHLCHLFVPAMRARGFGRVLNVASVAGRLIRTGDYSYGPPKAYLIALSEGMNGELKAHGVHVCALCPGFTHTEFHAVAGKLKLKERLPGFLWYDAEVVVREGLRAVEAGRPILVSGRLYRWLDPLFQSVFTRRWLRGLGGA
ncbi:MAG: SDR family NAD(P)-dependent oxidoreductase [Pseudomonadales bacterium]|jgi:short-subunit dehydrogenase|nr:SDR family NAD(P)-dependent oxidoreductase [Pseudomonadales bacterium]